MSKWRNGIAPGRGLLPIVCCLLSAPGFAAEKPVPSSEWAAAGPPPLPARMEKHRDGITSVVLHHTESPNQPVVFEKSRLVGIRRHHIEERRWGDIAYHYLVGPSGTIYQGRDESYRGDSGTSYDLDGRLLVCLVGNFMNRMPEPVAMRTMVEFVAAKLEEHGLEPSAVVTHRMVAATDCPGDVLQTWFEENGRETIGRALRGEPWEISDPTGTDMTGWTVPEDFEEIPSLARAPVSAEPEDVLLDVRFRSPDRGSEFGVLVTKVGHLGNSDYDRLVTWKPLARSERETSREKNGGREQGRIVEHFGISGPGDAYTRYFHRTYDTGNDGESVAVLWEWMVRDAAAREKWAEAYRGFKRSVDIDALVASSRDEAPESP